jgi:probable phosphoglycerate mutase
MATTVRQSTERMLDCPAVERDVEGAFQRRFRLAADAVELLLVRHGSTVRATPDRPHPRLGRNADPPLSENGRQQAEQLAAALRDQPISALFVTPLRRTHETAAPLAAALGLEPRTVEELRELYLGVWEGGEFERRFAARDPLARRVFAEERWDLVPGAEPHEAFAARVAGALETVADAVPAGSTAVCVTHGAVIAQACHHVTGSSPFAFIGVENASITSLVRRRSGRWSLRSFNETAHLGRVHTGRVPAGR